MHKQRFRDRHRERRSQSVRRDPEQRRRIFETTIRPVSRIVDDRQKHQHEYFLRLHDYREKNRQRRNRSRRRT